MLAPLSIIDLIWLSALFSLLNRPPSEKLSGVRFNTPIIRGSLKFKYLFRFCLLQTIFFTSFKIIVLIFLPNFEIFLMSIIFDFVTRDKISICLKAIFLLPQSGSANFFLIKSLASRP